MTVTIVQSVALDPRRMVLVHRRTRTVHELKENGFTACGNGNRGIAGPYDRIPKNKVKKGIPCQLAACRGWK